MSQGIDDESFLSDTNVQYNQTITNLASGRNYSYLINSTNSFGYSVTSIERFTTAEARKCKND